MWGMNVEHAPEPWEVGRNRDDGCLILDATGHEVAIATWRCIPDARRIVACANACAGIDTEVLEALPDDAEAFARLLAERKSS
jgi:hypothetical protein